MLIQNPVCGVASQNPIKSVHKFIARVELGILICVYVVVFSHVSFGNVTHVSNILSILICQIKIYYFL